MRVIPKDGLFYVIDGMTGFLVTVKGTRSQALKVSRTYCR